MKYLFVGSHPDDIELACGGTISKLQAKHEIVALIFSKCGIFEEAKKSAAHLGMRLKVCHFDVREFHKNRSNILEILYEQNKEERPDFIFTHSIIDKHQDHRVIAEESLRAFKNKNLITYCHPWNGNDDPNYFVALSKWNVDHKIETLLNYSSQAHRQYMNPTVVQAEAIHNGLKCGMEYAEAFRIEKLIV